MITCPICGVTNDPSNRFCDQCGARLDAARAGGGPAAGSPPAAITLPCPACGAPALPGQAFCDNCGHDLRDIIQSAASSPDTPTQIVTPPPPTDGGTVVVPPPGDAASPPAQPDPWTPTSPSAETAVPPPSPVQPDTETVLAPPPPAMQEPPPPPSPVQPDTETVIAAPPAPPAPPMPIPMPVPAEEEQDASSIQPDSETMLAQPVPQPAPASPGAETMAAPPPPAPPDEERHKLEEEVQRHRATVSQMEQMLKSYPSDAPAPEFLTQGLEGAQRALSQAETRLAGYSGDSHQPDPQEVARLEELIRVHSETIAQFERMKSSYPPDAAPVFLDDGIREARRALTKAEAQLAALKGEAPPSPSTAAPPSSSSSSPARTPVPHKPKETDALLEPAKGPRLEIFDGKHVFLFPKDKTDIIVGREDPVSYIFPEVDLTSVGGEAGGVSRQHARMTNTGGQWTVTDLNSTNHTRVNGERIEPENPFPIHDGTRLQFGRIVAIFRL
ncbi:MAG: FHA domain-containing protein [Chloroflexaceae bacterium]|nr:FHA domain-containing protein [Chloroflexaceae bacterium]